MSSLLSLITCQTYGSIQGDSVDPLACYIVLFSYLADTFIQAFVP